MIEEVFKKNKIKLTNQRKLVFNVVESLGEDATIKKIHDKCSEKVDISTIYRIIELLVDKKIFIKNLDFNGDIYYTINNNQHTHYIECIKCHKKTEIDYCPINEIKQHMSNKNEYTILSHTIKIDGICDNCKSHIAK